MTSNSDHNQHTELPPEDFTGIRKSDVAKYAAGLPAVTQSFKHVAREGIVRGTTSLLKLNQKNGFDCSSCAWPDPDDDRSSFEFCENGAKATASESTARKITRNFFEDNSITDIASHSDHWMELQGRLTEPMVLREDSAHYEPISWDEAFELVASELNSLSSPNQALFYTSGRASNEAAFLYQLFAREYGTNNLPDCSNMCHESSGTALREMIGVGKGTVTLGDFEQARVIFVVGQNPGTNHPRMLSSLQSAVRRGAKIVAVNPLKEAGLLAFAHPQEPAAVLGKKTPLASHFLQVKINGDMPLFQGIMKALLEREESAPGMVLDQEFIQEYTSGFEALRDHIRKISWDFIEEHSGISQTDICEVASLLDCDTPIISCWAMGMTQHRNAVASIQQIVNLHLLLGALGKEGAGLCPVRGHSNVQGDRTMGIWEKPPESFLRSLEMEFGFKVPREHGHDTVSAIKAMHTDKAKVFVALGGNFLSASPDTQYTAEALRKCNLTVQISTKLNRSHVVTGRQALILPCLVRSERDIQTGGEQFVTVENSMGIVHKTQGHLRPISSLVRSESSIISGIAKATLGEKSATPWYRFSANYSLIRDRIEKVIPGFEDFNSRILQPGGFYLPNAVKQRTFDVEGGRAPFVTAEFEPLHLKNGQLILQTFRSHDQFNTTIYGLDDRYRGILNERRVIFLNRDDMLERGISNEQPVDITSHFNGEERQANRFLAIHYDMPRGCAAAYFPETNVLVPVDSVADKSRTPTSKAVVITISSSC